MKGAANCQVTILRGTTTNTYGDLVDSDTTTVATRVPCSLIEQTRRTYIPAEGAVRIIRSYAGRVGAGVDLQKGDRVKRASDDVVFLVLDLGDPQSAALSPDISFTASRTT